MKKMTKRILNKQISNLKSTKIDKKHMKLKKLIDDYILGGLTNSKINSMVNSIGPTNTIIAIDESNSNIVELSIIEEIDLS